MTGLNTLFLRLEGPLQAWGDTSKFVIRRTMDAPTKSGVLGLLCCAMGLSRQKSQKHLPYLNGLAMGVRIDQPGTRWWDYQTVGAGIGIITADGKGIKQTATTGEIETLITRREYLADASFLVALKGDAKLVDDIATALAAPRWPVFLGRKSCPPSVPVLAKPCASESWTNPARYEDLNAALGAIPWHPRYIDNAPPRNGIVESIMEWQPTSESDIAPNDAEVWYDVPLCFDPPVHGPRFVLRGTVSPTFGEAILQPTPRPPRLRANYNNAEWKSKALIDDPQGRKDEKGLTRKIPKGVSPQRLQEDAHLCVFCKSPATTVHHITYRRAGGNETIDDLRSLCRLCHDAVTMIEYGYNMGLDRINPEEEHWRDLIIEKREEIIKFRSLETRRRKLADEEVE